MDAANKDVAFNETMSKVCTEITSLPLARDGSNKDVKRGSILTWRDPSALRMELETSSRAQDILKNAGFTCLDEPRLQLTILMLKNRSESLSAESDGLPAIAAFFTIWIAAVVAMGSMIGPHLSGTGVSWAAAMIGLLMGTYFLTGRLKTRRQVASLRELANHLDFFAKSLCRDPSA